MTKQCFGATSFLCGTPTKKGSEYFNNELKPIMQEILSYQIYSWVLKRAFLFFLDCKVSKEGGHLTTDLHIKSTSRPY